MEMSIKTPVRNYFITTRFVIIKHQKITSVNEDVKQLESLKIVGKNGKLGGQLQWKTVWWFFKKVNIEFLYDSVTPFLGIYPKELKTYVQTKAYP